LGPVGGATASPEETLVFRAVGAVGAAGTAVDGAGGGAVIAGFGGCGAVVGFASSAGFRHTLDENPKAGTAAGGDDARGA
jgi:hypothetical protein